MKGSHFANLSLVKAKLISDEVEAKFLSLQYILRSIQSNDEILLNDVKSLLGLSEGDFWGALPSDVKSAVNKAKGELDRGEGISHDPFY